MSAHKRTWEEIDDSDDDEPSFGRQTLPVANLPEDFSGEPIDGAQYLFMVRRDARYLPHVTRVVNPYEVPERPPPSLQENDGSQPKIIPHLPTKAWQTTFIRKFKNFKQNVVQPTIHVHYDPAGSNRKIMPDKKERDLWWAFIAGKSDSEWNPPKKPKQHASNSRKFNKPRKMRAFSDDPEPERDDSIDYISDQPAHETWRINEEGEVELASTAPDVSQMSTAPSISSIEVEAISAQEDIPVSPFATKKVPQVDVEAQVAKTSPREPIPTLLHEIDHRMALHLLMYFTHWINLHLEDSAAPTWSITDNHARWMFSLLSKIEDYVSADDMSLMRNLARACLGLIAASVRRRKSLATIAPDEEMSTSSRQEGSTISEASCWMVFTAVAGVWGQRDLWVDAEALLASL